MGDALAADKIRARLDQGFRAERERLAAALHEQCIGLGIGLVEPGEIDRLNIYRAALEAMRRAVVMLRTSCEPGHLLVDARIVPGVDLPQTSIVHGDAHDASIAAASEATPAQIEALYDEWVTDYERDVLAWGYVAPTGPREP